jgi:hypothetical protein
VVFAIHFVCKDSWVAPTNDQTCILYQESAFDPISNYENTSRPISPRIHGSRIWRESPAITLSAVAKNLFLLAALSDWARQTRSHPRPCAMVRQKPHGVKVLAIERREGTRV